MHGYAISSENSVKMMVVTTTVRDASPLLETSRMEHISQ